MQTTLTTSELLSEIGKHITDARDRRDMALSSLAIEEAKSFDGYSLQDLIDEADSMRITMPRILRTHDDLIAVLKAEQAVRVQRYREQDEHFTKMLRQLHVARTALEQI